jgi:hypothetical protein
VRRVLAGLLAVTVAGCGGGPNLDKAVAGESAAVIRERIVAHQHWGEKLSAEQLDQVAAFVASYAGRDGVADPVDPGLAIWKANGCGSCHVLAAAGDGDR